MTSKAKNEALRKKKVRIILCDDFCHLFSFY